MGPVVLVREDTPLRDVASLMLEHQVESVVVADGTGAVRGVVADSDLTLNQRLLRYSAITVPRLNLHWVTLREQVDAALVAAETMTARDAMDRRVTTAKLSEPLGSVVDRMLQRDAQCALVLVDGDVVGMLGRRDLLRLVAGRPEARPLSTTANGTLEPPIAHLAHQGGPGLGWFFQGRK
jgi:CBS domain-containing protein